jgi:predicted RNase H-like HicB family nuclease
MALPDYVVYPAIFDDQHHDGNYTVTFPDVPDTVTQGETLTAAFKNAPDALAIALLDRRRYPQATDPKVVQVEYPDAVVSLVGVDMKRARRRADNRTVRKNVTVPMDLAELAKKRGINFSRTLAEALELKLED